MTKYTIIVYNIFHEVILVWHTSAKSKFDAEAKLRTIYPVAEGDSVVVLPSPVSA